MSQIFNNRMKSVLFSDILKTARLKPLHKKFDKNNPFNYRPITILTYVFEKIINRRLVNVFEKYNILDKRRYSFITNPVNYINENFKGK